MDAQDPEIKFNYRYTSPEYSRVQSVDKNSSDSKNFKDYYNSNDFEVKDDFVQFLKNAENGIKVGFNKKTQRWTTFNDVGRLAIAYGHNLVGNERELFKNGITEQQAANLLMNDIGIASERCEKEIDGKFGFGEWSKLDNRRKEMLIDFMFNLGTLKSFPKFVKAVMTNDVETMKKEYVRYSNGKPLYDRNKRFFDRYFKQSPKK
jgi:GH24 family phage-related lysozyme (muramidase)